MVPALKELAPPPFDYDQSCSLCFLFCILSSSREDDVFIAGFIYIYIFIYLYIYIFIYIYIYIFIYIYIYIYIQSPHLLLQTFRYSQLIRIVEKSVSLLILYFFSHLCLVCQLNLYYINSVTQNSVCCSSFMPAILSMLIVFLPLPPIPLSNDSTEPAASSVYIVNR